MKFTFNEFDDLNDDDVGIEQRTSVLAYASGSGCKTMGVLMGGFGTCVKLLEGGHGTRTVVRPSSTSAASACSTRG